MGLGIAERRDQTKYWIFADYNGMSFCVGHARTIKRARECAKREMIIRNRGQALTMRIFEQVDRWRQPKGEV